MNHWFTQVHSHEMFLSTTYIVPQSFTRRLAITLLNCYISQSLTLFVVLLILTRSQSQNNPFFSLLSHPLTSFSHSLTNWLTHSFTDWLTHSLTHSLFSPVLQSCNLHASALYLVFPIFSRTIITCIFTLLTNWIWCWHIHYPESILRWKKLDSQNTRLRLLLACVWSTYCRHFRYCGDPVFTLWLLSEYCAFICKFFKYLPVIYEAPEICKLIRDGVYNCGANDWLL